MCGNEAKQGARISVNNERLRAVDLCDEHAAPLIEMVGKAKKPARRGVGDLPVVKPGDVESGKVGTRRASNTPTTAPETAPGAKKSASVGDRA